MGYYIIIRGPLGVGKSTIAKRLAEVLNGEYISIDLVLEECGLDKVGPGAECIPARNFIKANEKVIPVAKEKLEKGKKVVFDACFYHKEQIKHLIMNLSYPYHVFTLKAPLEVCIERDRKRKKRHGEEATRAVYKLVSRFDYGKVIETKEKSPGEVVKEMVSYLPKNIKSSRLLNGKQWEKRN